MRRGRSPRPELSRQFTLLVKSGQNVVVQGERRMGKTSFVCEAIWLVTSDNSRIGVHEIKDGVDMVAVIFHLPVICRQEDFPASGWKMPQVKLQIVGGLMAWR